MKVRIESDGSAFNTRVIDIETGRELKNVVRIEIDINARWPDPRVTAILTIEDVPLVMVADATVVREAPPDPDAGEGETHG